MKKGPFLTIILIIVIFILVFVFFLNKEESPNPGTGSIYLSEEGIAFKCDSKILSNELAQDNFYDSEENIIGSCFRYYGPTPLGMKCNIAGNCTSSELLTAPDTQEGCQGKQYQKYSCSIPQ